MLYLLKTKLIEVKQLHATSALTFVDFDFRGIRLTLRKELTDDNFDAGIRIIGH